MYFAGGSTALLLGIRGQTVDIDIKLDPEPEGAFEAIALLKTSLNVNVELASPDDFIPPCPGWRERSILIDTIGQVKFFHYDLFTQALAKLERGHDQDLSDVSEFIKRGFIKPGDLDREFSKIRTALIRYPAINADQFEQKLKDFLNKFK